jgi:hypothetical protein
MKGERSAALDRRVQEGCRQASAVLPGGRGGAKIRKSVKRELETGLLMSKRDLLPLAYLRPAFSFLIVDDTVLDKPKTDLNAHVLGVPAFFP